MTDTSREPFRPTLRTDADVTTMWQTLIRPLGWHLRRFSLLFVDPAGRPSPQVVEIDDVPASFARAEADHFVEFLGQVLDEIGIADGGSVALLACRPGPDLVTDDDRSLCGALYAAAREAGLRLRLLHLGTDTAIRPMPMDEVLPRTA